MSLEYRVAGETDGRERAPVLVLLHGRGSDESDLLALGRFLPGGWILVTPRAPFAGAPWGYGPGWAWYRYIAEDRPDPGTFSEAQAELDGFLASLPAELGVEPDPLVLGGFSQGGTMSLGRALRGIPGVEHVVNLSGFLPSHPDVDAANAQALSIFWGHGTMDPNIPFALAERGRRLLREAGIDVAARDYRMGHSISREEIDDLLAWLEEKATG